MLYTVESMREPAQVLGTITDGKRKHDMPPLNSLAFPIRFRIVARLPFIICLDADHIRMVNLQGFLTTAAVAVLAAEAVSIDHDKVQPFAQPEPVTISEKAAIKYKPKIEIGDACHPYPAVNAAGETSAGLKPTGSVTGTCKGSGLGSQVYGRAGWYGDKHGDMWAIMYAWYFPKNARELTSGHRHEWENIVVWLDDPEANPATVKALSVRSGSDYDIKRADEVQSYMSDTSPNLQYDSDFMAAQVLELAENAAGKGELQDLIMWEQLTEEARVALEAADFGDSTVPFKEATFQANLKEAWPTHFTRHRVNKIWYWFNGSVIASDEGSAGD